MQKRELRDHLKQRGLPENGLKDELIQRLKEEEKCGTVAHDKGNGAPAQPAASSSATGDTTRTPSTVKKVRKAQNSLPLIFVPTSPFGAVHVFKYE
jgi:hypothetical protein